MEPDYERASEMDYDSDRGGSATASEDMTLSPFLQHNGNYKSHIDEDTLVGPGLTKWLLNGNYPAH